MGRATLSIFIGIIACASAGGAGTGANGQKPVERPADLRRCAAGAELLRETIPGPGKVSACWLLSPLPPRGAVRLDLLRGNAVVETETFRWPAEGWPKPKCHAFATAQVKDVVTLSCVTDIGQPFLPMLNLAPILGTPP